MEAGPVIAAGGAAERARRAAPDDAALARAAQAFETTFLAEMLKHAGLTGQSGAFGGGAGEEAFASFLTQEHARLLAERGGIGIAEQVFESLKARQGTA